MHDKGSGLAGLPWTLLERIWPWDRVVLGLRVCRSLHRELLANPCRTLLSKRRLAAVTQEDLVKDFERVAQVPVTLKWQGGDTQVLAQALQESGIGDSLFGFVATPGSDFGASGPRQVFDVLETCKALKHLELRSNMLCDASVECIAQQVLLHCTSLAHLNLGYNNFGDLGALRLAELLQHCTVLAHLDVAMNAISGAGVSFFGQALEQWPSTSLRHLNLGHNALGITLDPNAPPPLELLAKGLKKSTGLTYLGCRGGRIHGAGVGPLASLLGALPELTSVDLSINSLGAPGAEVLAAGLRAGNALTDLRLTQNGIGDQGATALAEALEACSALTRLELGKNEITDGGVARLVQGMHGSSRLRQLDLSRNKIGAHGAQALGELPPERLTALDLSFNSCGDAACALPARLTALTCLALGNASVADAGAAQLATALLLCPALSRLELMANSLTSVAAPDLLPARSSAPAPSLQTATRVTSLEELLAAAHAPPAEPRATPAEPAPEPVVALGGVQLAEALGSCEAMAHLDLSQTGLGAAAAAALAQSMRRMASLAFLGLRYNNGMGPEGLGAVIEALPACPKLATVHLSWCRAGAGGVERLAGVLGECGGLEELLFSKNELDDDGATLLAGAIGRCSRLAVLDLGNNKITDAGAGALAAEVGKLPGLRKLVLKDNDIGDVGMHAIAAAVGQSPTLHELNLCSNRRSKLDKRALFPGVPRFNLTL